MAETDLILINPDASEIVTWFLNRGSWLVPDLDYEEPEYPEIRSLTDYDKYKESKLFFILHNDWVIEKLNFDFFTNDNNQKVFYISQKEGGPYLDFYFAGEYAKYGKVWAGTGFISHYPKFWINSQNQNIKAPDSLKSCYKDFVKFYKKTATPFKGRKRCYWASKKAVEQLESGERHFEITY